MEKEMVYVIPLRDVKKAVRQKRANRSVNLIREFVLNHVNADNVNVSQKINETLWSRSRQMPPKSVKVRVRVEENTAHVKAMDEMFVEKAKHEKKEEIKEDKAVSEPAVPDKAPEEKPKTETKKEEPQKEEEKKEKPKEASKSKAVKDEKTEKPSDKGA